VTRDDVVLSAGERLQVRFAWRGDRWAHTIEARDNGRAIWRLESQQTGDDPNWPPSPALQSLQLTAVPGRGNVALLLGMAGSSHWSASVEADSVGEQITFDIACRISTKPANLGSNYSLQMLEDGKTARTDGPRIELITSPESDAAQLSVETGEQKIVVRVATEQLSTPQTVRWRYFVMQGDSSRT
jgi:hypothetical protein